MALRAALVPSFFCYLNYITYPYMVYPNRWSWPYYRQDSTFMISLNVVYASPNVLGHFHFKQGKGIPERFLSIFEFSDVSPRKSDRAKWWRAYKAAYGKANKSAWASLQIITWKGSGQLPKSLQAEKCYMLSHMCFSDLVPNGTRNKCKLRGWPYLWACKSTLPAT